MAYEIAQGRPGQADYTAYGAARDFINCREPEVIISGPAETGKTLGALWKLHLCACKYPGASLVICRKTLTNAHSTVLQTFQKKVVPGEIEAGIVSVYGGEKPQWFDYANGSRIWVAGLDKAGKVLSAEHDIIYVNQVEELTLEDWETLTTRTTGRAGNMPYAQTVGDMNPTYPQHWIYSRDSLRVFYSRHAENPLLYDQETGKITPQGRKTMSVLERLTGVRRTRLLEGKPAQAEGAIYDGWDESVHLVDAAPQVLERFIAAQDWGYSNPGCFGVWGIDGDGRMYLILQIYHTRRLTDWWVQRAVEAQGLIPGKFEVVACDPSQPDYIQKYRLAGLNAQPADNQVLPGINEVKQRLKVAEDGKPRLFIVRGSERFIDEELRESRQPWRVQDEFPGYVWAGTTKEQPVKEHDHGMDMARYAVRYLDAPQKRRKAGRSLR